MPDLLQFSAPIELTASGGDKPPRVSIMAYNGGAMTVPGFGPTVIDLTGLDVSHPVQILAEHRDSIDGLLGTGTATKSKSDLQVHGTLTRANPLTERILAMSKDGVSFSASVGVQPLEREIIREGQTLSANGRTITAPRGGMVFVKRGVLRETSLVAIGADASASVAIAASAKHRLKGTRQMTESELLSPENVARVNASLPNEMRCAWDREGLSDAERVEARLDAFRRNHGDILPGFGSGMVRAAASGSLTWADAEREILRAEVRAMQSAQFRAQLPKAPAIHASRSDAGPDMLQAALLCHLGAENVSARCFGDQVTQSARDARMTSLVEILQASFRANGEEAPRDRNSLIKAAFSTASIANIVSNVQNKILLDQWARLPMTWPSLCKQVSASNFKEGKAIRLGGRSAMLDQLGAAGEIKHGHLTDTGATFQIDTFARAYSITRQDIINDDLGALDELPKVIARGAALKMESVLWTLILGNADDFFGDDNGNQLADVLDIDGLGAAVAVMRALTDADGEPVLVEPRTLVVPPALEATADALYASTNVVVSGGGDTVTTAPSASPFAGKYKPLCSPYISNAKYTGYSTTQWYLFADPNSGPAAFLAAFLNGMTNPTIEQSDTDFNTLGVHYRGFLDFGFAQCDSQGAVKSTGLGG